MNAIRVGENLLVIFKKADLPINVTKMGPFSVASARDYVPSDADLTRAIRAALYPLVLETTLPETGQRCWVFPLEDENEVTSLAYSDSVAFRTSNGPYEEPYLVVSTGILSDHNCHEAISRTFHPEEVNMNPREALTLIFDGSEKDVQVWLREAAAPTGVGIAPAGPLTWDEEQIRFVTDYVVEAIHNDDAEDTIDAKFPQAWDVLELDYYRRAVLTEIGESGNGSPQN